MNVFAFILGTLLMFAGFLHSIKAWQERDAAYHGGTMEHKADVNQAAFLIATEATRVADAAKRKKWERDNAELIKAEQVRFAARVARDQAARKVREAARAAAEADWKKIGEYEVVDDEEIVEVHAFRHQYYYNNLSYLDHIPEQKPLDCLTKFHKVGKCDPDHIRKGRCVCVQGAK